jgi:hypothetical protein
MAEVQSSGGIALAWWLWWATKAWGVVL